MAKLTVKLKQHTPLIHFQHDQDGATLRATELKPKLDKFLIEKKVFGEDCEKYLLSGQGKAFDYKVKIKNVVGLKEDKIEIDYTKRNGKIGEKQFPLFFGNTGVKDKNQKKFFLSSNNFYSSLKITR